MNASGSSMNAAARIDQMRSSGATVVTSNQASQTSSMPVLNDARMTS